MNRIIKKEDEGKFGELVAGSEEYRKQFYGTVLHVDRFGTITFVDNDDISYRFVRTDIISFEEKEFENLLA